MVFRIANQTKGMHTISEREIIPARSEKLVTVKCRPQNSLVLGDFEASSSFNLNNQLYNKRARVRPNTDGMFLISYLNTSESDITLETR